MIGGPPSDAGQDWLAVVRPGDPKRDYDPTQAKKVHKQTDGIVVVEADDFDAVDRQHHRKWYLTTADETPNMKPDPDRNHAEQDKRDGAAREPRR